MSKIDAIDFADHKSTVTKSFVKPHVFQMLMRGPKAVVFRPRSHSLDQEACTEFAKIVPSEWVIREVKPDYGVDFQVEIFEMQHTGLFFHVQLKATDNMTMERKAVIEVDRLDYLRALDIPAVIVRWCSKTNGFYAMWLWEAISQVKSWNNKEITLTFQEHHRINGKLGDDFRRTTQISRKIKSRAEHLTICFLPNLSNAADGTRISITRLLTKLENDPRFCPSHGDENLIPIELIITSDSVMIGVDELSREEWTVDTSGKLVSTCLFAMLALLRYLGLHEHARIVARLVLAEGIISDDSFLATEACLSLFDDHEDAIGLALMQSVNEYSDDALLRFVISALAYYSFRPEATDRLLDFLWAVARFPGHSLAKRANYHNLVANFLATKRQHYFALLNFRYAFEYAPHLFSIPSLQLIIIKCLIARGRIKMARKIINLMSGDDKAIELMRADLHLLSGDYERAIHRYKSILETARAKGNSEEGDINYLHADISVKMFLCNMLEKGIVKAKISELGLKGWGLHLENARDVEDEQTGDLVLLFQALIRALFLEGGELNWSLCLAVMMLVDLPEGLAEEIVITAVESSGFGAFSHFAANHVGEDDRYRPDVRELVMSLEEVAIQTSDNRKYNVNGTSNIEVLPFFIEFE